ncbi:hypothetical protein FOCC_FOCC008577 [Frankliniella occidentalis]|nr:hypothetical protein FOCC_FOCC008577 [Frankliniella occidentalis]
MRPWLALLLALLALNVVFIQAIDRDGDGDDDDDPNDKDGDGVPDNGAGLMNPSFPLLLLSTLPVLALRLFGGSA